MLFEQNDTSIISSAKYDKKKLVIKFGVYSDNHKEYNCKAIFKKQKNGKYKLNKITKSKAN